MDSLDNLERIGERVFFDINEINIDIDLFVLMFFLL